MLSFRNLLRASLAPALLATVTSCVTHSTATEFNGVDGVRGTPVEYLSTTSYALHGLFVFPLSGNGSMQNTMDKYTEEAAKNGASRTRIVQTSSHTYWWIFPPISFFVHPVVTTVSGTTEEE